MTVALDPLPARRRHRLDVADAPEPPHVPPQLRLRGGVGTPAARRRAGARSPTRSTRWSRCSPRSRSAFLAALLRGRRGARAPRRRDGGDDGPGGRERPARAALQLAGRGVLGDLERGSATSAGAARCGGAVGVAELAMLGVLEPRGERRRGGREQLRRRRGGDDHGGARRLREARERTSSRPGPRRSRRSGSPGRSRAGGRQRRREAARPRPRAPPGRPRGRGRRAASRPSAGRGLERPAVGGEQLGRLGQQAQERRLDQHGARRPGRGGGSEVEGDDRPEPGARRARPGRRRAPRAGRRRPRSAPRPSCGRSPGGALDAPQPRRS